MDEGEGSGTADASPQHLAGDIHGAQWNVGRFGHGLAFDGSGVYLDVPSHPKLCPRKAITVEAWIKLQAPNADVICKNTSYFMRITGGVKAYFFVDGKWRILGGNRALALRRWTHVAMTYDSSSRTMRTFIDGALDGEKKLDGLKSYELGQSQELLRIGRNTWRVTGGVVGKVDEVRISDVARTFEPFQEARSKQAPVFVPNGSFEFGRYGWRSHYESNSRLEWRLDSGAATHGRWSLRSIAEKPATIITKPFPFVAGPDYVLSADLRADAPSRKAALRIASTRQPKRTRVRRLGRTFDVGPKWRTVSVPVTGTQVWQSGWAYVSIGKQDGTLWVDNVQLRRIDTPAATDAVGVRFATGRQGDTFFANTSAEAPDVQVVNASSTRRRVRVVHQTADFFGVKLPQVDHGAFELAAHRSEPLSVAVDTSRRGPFRIDFEVTDLATQKRRRTSHRYNVILPLKGVGDGAASPFGMNTHMEREPNEHLSCNLEMLSQCGVKWIRGWWGWGMAEKQPGQFDWTEYERQYGLVTDQKMHMMPILLRYYPPYEQAWAGLVDKIQRPPYKLEQWGQFVFETVSRFKDRVRCWEIWNEPGYSAGFTPELYAELCKITYAQARRADAKCTLVGFAGVGLPFMEKAADAGALASMDIMGEHSYAQLASPETAIPGRCDQVRALLKQRGRPMPIWHTEQGTGADGDGYVAGLLTEEDCASSLVRGYISAIAAGVEKFFWFSAQTSPTYGWAVFYEDYVPRPRLVALNGMASQLEGAAFRESLRLGDNAVAHVFQKGRAAVVATWNLTWPVSLRMPTASAEVRIVDMMGNTRSLAPRGAEVKVSLHHRHPVYLVFANTTAADAAKALGGAALNEEPLWEIKIARRQGGAAVEAQITSRATEALDAIVTVSAKPAVRFVEDRQFLHHVKPGETRLAIFRCADPAVDRLRTITVGVAAGPLRLRRAEAQADLRL